MSVWHVLNLNGRDGLVDFGAVGCSPDPGRHAPVNYHAYAACRGGRFTRSADDLPDDARDVIVLIRKGNLGSLAALIERLRERGIRAWISLKESGSHQITDLIADPKRWAEFCALCQLAENCLASTPDSVAWYQAAGAKRVEFVPTPYPVDHTAWDFSTAGANRDGIFIGTREFNVPSRRHFAAVAIAARIAKSHHTRVVVMNPGGRAATRLLDAIRSESGLGDRLDVRAGELSYTDYLRLMTSCRVVWQLDHSRVPGQVAGDALLCRIPCLGGDGAVDRLGHPESNGLGRSDEELAALLDAALHEPPIYEKLVQTSQAAASEHLSFAAISNRLEEIARDRENLRIDEAPNI